MTKYRLRLLFTAFISIIYKKTAIYSQINKQHTSLNAYLDFVHKLKLRSISPKLFFFLSKLPTRQEYTRLIKYDSVSFHYYSGEYDDLHYSSRWDFADYEPTSRLAFNQLAASCSHMVDVGAYTGLYSLAAAASSPNLTVTLFEPNQKILKNLRKNIELNGFEQRFTVVDKGVSSRTGLLTFYPQQDASYTSASSFDLQFAELHSSSEENFSSEKIMVTTLDAFFAHSPVALIKIDVEGLEIDVIEGSFDVISNYRPIFLIEVLKASTLKTLTTTFLSHGYGKPIGAGQKMGDDRNYFFAPKKSFRAVKQLLDNVKDIRFASKPSSTYFSRR